MAKRDLVIWVSIGLSIAACDAPSFEHTHQSATAVITNANGASESESNCLPKVHWGKAWYQPRATPDSCHAEISGDVDGCPSVDQQLAVAAIRAALMAAPTKLKLSTYNYYELGPFPIEQGGARMTFSTSLDDQIHVGQRGYFRIFYNAQGDGAITFNTQLTFPSTADCAGDIADPFQDANLDQSLTWKLILEASSRSIDFVYQFTRIGLNN